jgi:phosphoribosyl-ATP pyrophosphohydrolase
MDQQHPIDRLHSLIESRRHADAGSSYTAALLAKGPLECAKKLGEEGLETALAAAARDKTGVVRESADLLYHLLVLWAASGIDPAEVYTELRAREAQSGLKEKAERSGC